MNEEVYAGIFQRIVAGIIDQVIVTFVAMIFVVLGFVSLTTANIQGIFLFMGISYFIWIIYYTFFEGSRGQTIGKMAMHIKVIKKDGMDLGYGDAFLRTIFRIIDNLPSMYILGIIVIIVTPEKQRIGDMIAGTVVIPTD